MLNKLINSTTFFFYLLKTPRENYDSEKFMSYLCPIDIFMSMRHLCPTDIYAQTTFYVQTTYARHYVQETFYVQTTFMSKRQPKVHNPNQETFMLKRHL